MSRNMNTVHIRTITLVAASLVVAAAVVGGIIVFANHYLSSKELAAASRSALCHIPGHNHVVTIKDNQVTPQHIQGKLCDVLIIVNRDDIIRLIAFGPHEQHVAYDGITDEVVSQDQSVRVTLNELGTYQFHDHIHDEVVGDFIVTY